MSVNQYKRNVVYGLGQPLHSVPPQPISSNRAPTTSDRAELLTQWGNKLTGAAWTLTGITANSATWTPITVNAGAVIDTGDLTVTTGDINVSAGDVTTTIGDFIADAGDVIVTLGGVGVTAGDIVVGAGDITATLGNITAGADVAARSVFLTGDEGTGQAGEVLLTNVVDETLNVGAGTVLMTTANPGNSSGWLKIYNGTGVRYIPYWTNISP